MKSLLSSTAYIVLNKDLARKIGLKEAVLLADLISKEDYFNKLGECKNGWFFNTEANIFNDTTLTPRQQRKCLKTLKKHQIIDVKRMGIPAKNFYKINEQLVMQLLNNLSSDKVTTFNNNKLIRNNNKYFKEPKILEIENYCKERNNNIDAKAFFNLILPANASTLPVSATSCKTFLSTNFFTSPTCFSGEITSAPMY